MLADEILVIGDGRVLQSGPTASLFLRPASELVARLLGAQAIAHGIAARRSPFIRFAILDSSVAPFFSMACASRLALIPASVALGAQRVIHYHHSSGRDQS